MRMGMFDSKMVCAVCALAGSLYPTVASGQLLRESAKLLASDGAAQDWFGQSVSVFGDVAVVGSPKDDDNGTDSGSVYVYSLSGSGWAQEQKLLPSDGASGDQFGISASVFGDMAIVGAALDDDNGGASGSAYMYRWSGSAWVQWQKLVASDGAGGDQFGRSVSVFGDTAVVGAPDDDDNGGNSGSAYVYRWNGSLWVQEQKLLASNGVADDYFGTSVSVSGNVALVGGMRPGYTGSAYVYRFNGSAWIQEQELLPSSGWAGDAFGSSVSVSGDVAVVGAWNDDDVNGLGAGAAYVYRFNGSAWVEEQKLLASDGGENYSFGYSVSVSGGVAVVGSPWFGTGFDSTGAAYVYRFSDGTWVEERKLMPCDTAWQDLLGNSVSVSGNVAVAGAYWDDDNGGASGSAFVFDLPAASTADLDGDGDVDLLDFGMFQTQFTGPN